MELNKHHILYIKFLILENHKSLRCLFLSVMDSLLIKWNSIFYIHLNIFKLENFTTWQFILELSITISYINVSISQEKNCQCMPLFDQKWVHYRQKQENQGIGSYLNDLYFLSIKNFMWNFWYLLISKNLIFILKL